VVSERSLKNARGRSGVIGFYEAKVKKMDGINMAQQV
jgi:hypothetical protein